MTPGSCNSRGLAIYTQSFTENKVGGCPESAKSKKMACCYQVGDWTDITQCNSIGRKTQQQNTAGNCIDSVKTRKVDCEYIGPWTKTGGCGSDGKQWYIRTTVHSDEDTRKSENCCYKGAWNAWGAWSACDGSKRSRTRTRAVTNCDPDVATSETEYQDCNHCEGAFGGWGGWSGETATCRGSGYYEKTRTRKYNVTKVATNGGNACPHTTGHTETETSTRSMTTAEKCRNRCSGCPRGCFISDTRIKLDNGDEVEIKDLMLGDVLEGGVTVNATLQIRNVDNAPFYKVFSEDLNDYIYVTGSHMIKENDKFVRVDECSFTEISDVVCDKFICLITDDHSIPIGGHVFRDWADTCDACNSTTILQ